MTNIVWSKNGILAYARDQTVYYTWPRCTDGVTWKLIEPTEISIGRQVAFLSFGPYFDLAVVDETGRIEIIEILPGGKHKIKCAWLSVADPRPRPEELDKIVGIYWLNHDKSLGLPTSVPRVQKPQPGVPPPNTKCVWDSVKPCGPLHPVHGKTCLLAVTGNGMCRVIVELAEGFREVSVALPTALTISAVAFCPLIPNSLLIAAYCDSTVLLFKMTISFSSRLMVADPPDDILNVAVVPMAATSVTEPLIGELRVFELIKSPLMPQSRPIIHAIFTSQQSSQVLIFKMFPWTEKLHTAFQRFEQQPKEKEEHWKLSLSDSRTTSKAIKSYVMTKTGILIIYVDSTIESQNLINVPMVLPGRDLVFNLDSTDNICFSPNLCIAAQLPPESGLPKLTLLSASKLTAQMTTDMPTVIATSYAFSVYNYIHCDDLLQVVWRWINVDFPKHNIRPQIFTTMLIGEAQRLLNVPFDPNEDPSNVDKFIVIPSSLQRWLMLQMFLGTSKNWKRTPQSLLAGSSLHIQYTAFVMKWTLRRIAPKQGEQLNPEQQMAQLSMSCYHINGMMGLVRWFTDFVAHINQEIFLATTQPGAPSDKMEKIDPKQDPSVLYLSKNPGTFINVLLSKVMRWLLLFIMRGIKGIETLLNHLVQQEKMLHNGGLGVAYLTLKKFSSIINTGPVPLGHFDKLLAEIDKQLQVLYKNDKIQDRVKQALELELLRNHVTPAAVLPIISHTIKLFKTQLLGHINVPSLYFYDTSWLRINENVQSSRDKVDAIKSFVISSNQNLRKCTRCDQVSAIESAKQAQLNQRVEVAAMEWFGVAWCGLVWHGVTRRWYGAGGAGLVLAALAQSWHGVGGTGMELAALAWI